jgi:hypothetical protein
MVLRQGFGRSRRIYVPRKLAVWLAAFFLCAGALSHFEARATEDTDLEGYIPSFEAQATEGADLKEVKPLAETPDTKAEGVKEASEAPAKETAGAEAVNAASEAQPMEAANPESVKPASEPRAKETTGAEEAKPHSEARAEETDLEGVKPALMTREMWNAEPALDGMWPHKPKGIVIHHTGVGRNLQSTLPQKMKGLQHFSQRMMHPSPFGRTIWLDAPYHFYIDAKGDLAEGRDANFTSDSNTFYDTHGLLQVVIEGDFQREIPSAQQMEMLRKTLVWLTLKWNIDPDRIVWHRAKAPTNCPGKNLLNQLVPLSIEVIQSRQKAIEEICAKTPSAEFAANYCSKTRDSHAGLSTTDSNQQ